MNDGRITWDGERRLQVVQVHDNAYRTAEWLLRRCGQRWQRHRQLRRQRQFRVIVDIFDAAALLVVSIVCTGAVVGKIAQHPIAQQHVFVIVVSHDAFQSRFALLVYLELLANRHETSACAHSNAWRSVVGLEVALDRATLICQAILGNHRVEHDDVGQRAVEIGVLRVRRHESVQPT